MLTLTFCLQFGDGQSITAQIQAKSSFEDAPVQYCGPLKRLPLAPMVASGVELRAYLQSFARELGARLSETSDLTGGVVEPEQSETA